MSSSQILSRLVRPEPSPTKVPNTLPLTYIVYPWVEVVPKPTCPEELTENEELPDPTWKVVLPIEVVPTPT